MRPARQCGFTLIGLSVALFVVSVILAIATPGLQRMQRTARAQATLADLQHFETVLQQYAHDRGDWPKAVDAPSAYPPGVEASLAGTSWSKPTPLGGRYVWFVETLQRGERLRASVGIVSSGRDHVTTDKRQLDELLRQANAIPSLGRRVRLGFRNEPIFVLEH